jgi:small GTP-binding protein
MFLQIGLAKLRFVRFFSHRPPNVLLTAVLVGTKSVGKSTLFNVLVGEKLAIVDATPGTTRDWKQGLGALGGLRFNVIDTPGIDPVEAASDKLAKGMLALTMGAISKAQVLLYVIDWRVGVTEEDARLCRLIKQQVSRGPPKIYIVANKAEAVLRLDDPYEDESAREGIQEVLSSGVANFHTITHSHSLSSFTHPKY